MTDDADLTPEREAAVRRLLGSVGSADAPALPADVSDRLDATLADLVAERSVPSPEEPLAPVVPLSSRRRRTFAALFVAAAAVVIAGIGVPLLHDDSSTQQTASSDMAVGRTPSSGVAATAPRAASQDQANGTNQKLAGTESYRALDSTVTLRRHTLRADLVRLRRQVPPDATYRSAAVHAPAGFTCHPARFGRGYLLGTRYAGAPAVVAFRAPNGSTQVAEVLQCGTARVLRSITLPTP